MSKLQKVLFAAGLIAALPAFAGSSASDTVVVRGVVVKALTVEAKQGLRFGEVVKGSFTEGPTSVTIEVTDQATGAFSVSYTGAGSPDVSASLTGTESIASVSANRSIIGPGKVEVKGEPEYHYTLTPSPVTGISSPVSMFAIFEAGAANISSTLDEMGEDVIYVGGIMTVPQSVTPLGDYNGTLDITVIYD